MKKKSKKKKKAAVKAEKGDRRTTSSSCVWEDQSSEMKGGLPRRNEALMDKRD